MIAMLILAIVCVAWLEIIGIQSARREARRREAVERLAGMMDAFMAITGNTKLDGVSVQSGKYYYLDIEQGLRENTEDVIENGYGLKFKGSNAIAKHLIFNEDISPICYTLAVEDKNPLPNYAQGTVWKINKACLWLVGRLYDKSDDASPFFTLPVCLGFPQT